MELYLHTEKLLETGRAVIDGNDGNHYSIDQARELIESGEVDDMSLSLARLQSFDWDVDELRRYYEDLKNEHTGN